MRYHTLGQQDGQDPSEYSISTTNLLAKVSAPCRISEHIISSLISHHHAKILIGIKQKQMAEKWGGLNTLDTNWSRQDGYEVQDSRIILCITSFLHSFNKPSTNFQLVCAIPDGERLESLGCRMVLPRFLGFLDVFLQGGRKWTNRHKCKWDCLAERKRETYLYNPHLWSEEERISLSEKGPFYIQHYLGQRSNPHFYCLYSIRAHVAELQKHNTNCQGYSDAQRFNYSLHHCQLSFLFFFYSNDNLQKLPRPRLFKWQTGPCGDCKKTLLFHEAAAKCKW